MKYFKKPLSIILALCMMITLVIPAFAADDDAVTGSLGGDVTYTAVLVGGTGMGQSQRYEVTISGTGTMNDFDPNRNISPLVDLTNNYSISSVTIEEGVTNIGSYLFYVHGGLEVTVAGSVEEIHSYAFTTVRNNSEITFLGSAPTISSNAFYNSSLTIYYPEDDDSWDSVVGNEYGANKIEWVPYGEFPKGDCGDDVHWYLIDGVLTIYGNGETWTNYTSSSHPEFYDYRDEIEEVVIESGVTTISASLLRGLSMTKITIPATVESIGLAAFYNCTKLASITLPEPLTEIGMNAFNGCAALTSITIPENVTSIGNNAFQNTSINVIIFTGDPPQFGTSTLILNGVSGTGYYPGDNENWTEQVLSSTYGGTFEWVPYYGDVPVPEPEAVDKSALAAVIEEARGEDESKYTEDSWAVLTAALAEAEAVYADDTADQTAVDDAAAALSAAIAGLVEKTEEPEPGAVDKSALAAVIEEARGENESRYTEDSWSALTAALDEAEAVYADGDADQTAVDDATAALSAAIAGLVEKEEEPGAADKCGENMYWSYEGGVLTIRGYGEMNDYSYANLPWAEYRNDITTVVFENEGTGITKLSNYSFADMTSLTDVTLPKTLETIGTEMFSGCSSLTSIELPASLESIGENAFFLTGLEEVKFTGNAPEINSSAFMFITASSTTGYYPLNNSTWTEEFFENDNSGLIWVGYEPEPEAVDKSALAAVIEEAKGEDESKYTEDSWTTLTAALADAEAVYADDAADQAAVDAATSALSAAIAGLVEKEEEPEPETVDKSALAAVIEEAKGEDESKYTEGSWAALTAALAEAEAVYADDAADQTAVDDAAAALSAAIAGLVEKEEEPEPEAVDKSALAAAIEEARGEDESKYTEDSWAALTAALADAEAVYADDDADQAAVDAATSALTSAIAELVTAATDTEKEALSNEIENAEESLSEGSYTTDSVADLQDAIDAANAVLAEGSNASEEAVADAMAALQDAMKALETAATDEEKEALSEEIASAEESLSEGSYTADSVANLNDAIEAANAVLAEGSNASEEAVADAMAALQDAVKALETAATEEEKEALSEEIASAEATLSEGSYTADSVANLQKAIEAANAVLAEGSNASEEDVANAIADIQAAIAALVENHSITGFASLEGDGNWYYYINGEIDRGLNTVMEGTVKDTNGWWYVVDGQVMLNYTGVCDYSNEYGWWYVVNGKVDFGKTSIEPNIYGWWRVVNGKVDFSCNSVEQNDYGWWYVLGGQVQFGFTGLANYGNAYGWWYIENGKVNFDHNCVDQNNYGWWYVVGSQVQFGYTGVANYANEYGWWYINAGKVDFSKTSIEQNNYGWWRVVNGQVDFSCNSVEQNDYGWWYVLGGKVDFSYTGVANYANAYGWWYISNGKVDFGYTGRASNNYGTWYCVNGKVDFSKS